jgi:hypothetical protein
VLILKTQVPFHQTQYAPKQHGINRRTICSNEVAAGNDCGLDWAVGAPHDPDRPELQRLGNRRNRVLTHQKGRTALNHIEI